MNHLKNKHTAKCTQEQMKSFVDALKRDPDGAKLTRAEIMQFVNLRPTQVRGRKNLIFLFNVILKRPLRWMWSSRTLRSASTRIRSSGWLFWRKKWFPSEFKVLLFFSESFYIWASALGAEPADRVVRARALRPRSLMRFLLIFKNI